MRGRRVEWVVGLLAAGAWIVAMTAPWPAGEAPPTPPVVPAPAWPAPVAIAGPSMAPERPPTTPATPDLAPCPPEGLQIDVVPTKATFLAGDTVGGMFFVQTGRAVGCAVAMPTSFRIEEVATGKVVGNVAATSEYPSAIKSDGWTYTSTFEWDRQDCSGATCVPVPPSLYQAVAEWTGGSPYRGWGEFRIGG